MCDYKRDRLLVRFPGEEIKYLFTSTPEIIFIISFVEIKLSVDTSSTQHVMLPDRKMGRECLNTLIKKIINIEVRRSTSTL